MGHRPSSRIFSLVSQENQNTESIFTLLDMDKFLMLALAILVMAACKPFVDASSCDETQGAINDANFFILTSLPPLNGEVQSVQIVGSQNNEYGALRFARCRQLASYERAKPLTPHMAQRSSEIMFAGEMIKDGCGNISGRPGARREISARW
ncbi:hypothetical protein ACLH1L_15825 [Klebsiella sp. 1SOBk11mer]|uniref:hypothetical protein n=1 Tax=Klebsiella sp. 1SOBk11mer TaxID=3391009 RepID=UPI003982E0AB